MIATGSKFSGIGFLNHAADVTCLATANAG